MPPPHSRNPQRSQRPAAIDRAFWQQLSELTDAMKNLVERSSPVQICAIPGWHPFLMVATRATQAIYESISYLSADSPADPLRKLEFGICTSPLIRSLADLLFTIIFIGERPKSRIKRYHRAGWRETKEMLLDLEKRHGSHASWREKLTRLNAALEDLRIGYQISRRTARKPKTLPKWPIPSAMLRQERFCARTKRFSEHLTIWYRELSQDHHMSGGGIIRVYGKLLLEPTDTARETTLTQLKSDNLMLTVVLVLAIATEINKIGRFDRGERLAYLWGIMTQNRSEAREVFSLRYHTLLRRALHG
jgi:hypothetical protein